uniref:Uncharacterized protein n=1 Tax=Knipowitschia caucasica TaxID=637954 RepID=A0AAV2JI64_KNICA
MSFPPLPDFCPPLQAVAYVAPPRCSFLRFLPALPPLPTASLPWRVSPPFDHEAQRTAEPLKPSAGAEVKIGASTKPRSSASPPALLRLPPPHNWGPPFHDPGLAAYVPRPPPPRLLLCRFVLWLYRTSPAYP